MEDHEWARTNKRNLKYLVKWRGFEVEDGDWLSNKELKDCKQLVDEYHKKKGLEPLNWGTLKEGNEGVCTSTSPSEEANEPELLGITSNPFRG